MRISQRNRRLLIKPINSPRGQVQPLLLQRFKNMLLSLVPQCGSLNALVQTLLSPSALSLDSSTTQVKITSTLPNESSDTSTTLGIPLSSTLVAPPSSWKVGATLILRGIQTIEEVPLATSFQSMVTLSHGIPDFNLRSVSLLSKLSMLQSLKLLENTFGFAASWRK